MLTAKEGVLDFAEHFIKPIPYNKLSTDLRLNFDDKSWDLSSNNIDFSSDELALTAEIVVSNRAGDDATMSLLANVENVNAEYMNHYFPHLLMGEDLVSYLNSAIISGEVNRLKYCLMALLTSFLLIIMKAFLL